MGSEMIRISHETLERYQNWGLCGPNANPMQNLLFESIPKVSPKASKSPVVIQPDPSRTSSCNSPPIEHQVRLLVLQPEIWLELIGVKIGNPFIVELAPNVTSRGVSD